MPRTRSKRGGPRQGQPGAAYTNRQDLNEKPRLPVAAAAGQEYGARKAQEDAQRAMPMAAAPPPPTPGAAGPPPGPAPGSFGPLTRPTERPNEPMTAGVPMGPGPGPEALQMNQGDPDLALLRPYLPTLELLASQPNASSAARNFVRRVRGAMPPQR